jgi:hypothetical protein
MSYVPASAIADLTLRLNFSFGAAFAAAPRARAVLVDEFDRTRLDACERALKQIGFVL